MNYETIADIYSANEKIREALHATLDGISNDEAATLPDGEKWSIQHIVEHLSLVETGISLICTRLLDDARTDGETSDGSFSLSDKFREQLSQLASGRRVEAPERVQPTGDVAIAESVAKLTAATDTLKSLRPGLESTDVTGHTFPHPFFGLLNPAEWLVIAGLHERRHTTQIEGLLSKIKQ
jgi:hypothetical protein